jgi:hypothetical protein
MTKMTNNCTEFYSISSIFSFSSFNIYPIFDKISGTWFTEKYCCCPITFMRNKEQWNYHKLMTRREMSIYRCRIIEADMIYIVVEIIWRGGNESSFMCKSECTGIPVSSFGNCYIDRRTCKYEFCCRIDVDEFHASCNRTRVVSSKPSKAFSNEIARSNSTYKSCLLSNDAPRAKTVGGKHNYKAEQQYCPTNNFCNFNL